MLSDIPTYPPTTPSPDDLVAVIDLADRRSPKRATVADLISGGGGVLGDGTGITDPSAFREALEAPSIVQSDGRNTQRHAAARINGWFPTGGNNIPLRVLVAGDSLSTGIQPFTNMAITGYMSQGYHHTGGPAIPLSPQGTLPPDDDWVKGTLIQVPVGTTIQYHPTGGIDFAFPCSQVSVGFIAEPGAGGFDIETQCPQRNSGQWEKVGTTQSTENATKIGRYVTVPLPTSTAPRYRVRITNVTGKPLKLICWGVWSDISWGIIWMTGITNFSGRDISAWPLCPDSIFNPIFAGLQPEVIISRWADAASEWNTGGAFRSQYARLKAAWPSFDVIQLSGGPAYNGADAGFAWPNYYIAQTQYRVNDVAIAQNDSTKLWGRYICKLAHTQQADRKPGQGVNWTTYWDPYIYNPAIIATGESDFQAQAEAQSAWAEEFNETFVDVREVYGNYESAFANGLIGDFVHPTAAGWTAMNAALERRVDLGRMPLGGLGGSRIFNFGISPVDNMITLNRGLNIGGTFPILKLEPIDLTTDSRRGLTITNSNGIASFNVDSIAAITIHNSANGAGQHALAPTNPFVALGTLTTRFRTWFGGVSSGTRTESANYAIAPHSDHTIYANAAAGAMNVTLPTASACPGHLFVIKKIDADGANAVTVVGTVDGAANPTLTSQWQVLRVRSNGTTYYAE